MIRLKNILNLSIGLFLLVLVSAWSVPAMAVPWDGGAAPGPPDGDGLWTTAANWNPNAVPAGVSAEINLNNADVALNDGSTQSIAGFQLGDTAGVTSSLIISNGSTLDINGTNLFASGNTSSVANLTMNNGHITDLTGGQWSRRGGTVNLNMSNGSTINATGGFAWGSIESSGDDRIVVNMANSTINLTSGNLTIGLGRNDQRAEFQTFDANSQFNITAGSMVLRGGNPSGPGGHAVYNIPLTTTAAANGKFFVNNSVTGVASGANSRVTLDLDAAGTVGKLQSDASLSWKGNGMSIASESSSIGIVNLKGITITNLGSTEIGRRTNANGSLIMVNSTITKSGGTNLAMENTGTRGTLSLTNSVYNESGQIWVGNGAGVGSDGYATFSLAGTSQINITTSNLRLDGGNPSATGGIAVYDLPMAAAANTNGKIYAHTGLHIAGNTNNKVRVNLTSATSDTNLNWHGAGMIVGEGSTSTGQLFLDGVNISGISGAVIGRRNGADSTLSIKGATVTKDTAGFDFYVGYPEGTPKGQVILDNGNVTVTNGSFRNRGIAGAATEIRGKGAISVTSGSFVNEGRVVADGGLLSITASGGVTSANFAVAQAAFGQAGLYAVNAGKLTLPNLNVAANTAITWGEESADATPDYVNSVRFTSLTGMGGAQTLSGSVLASNHSTVPVGLTGIVSVWDFSGLTFTNATMRARYDDAGLTVPQQANLKLWHYKGGTWQNITSVNDTSAGAKWIDSIGFNSLSPFAVAEDNVAVVNVTPNSVDLGTVITGATPSINIVATETNNDSGNYTVGAPSGNFGVAGTGLNAISALTANNHAVTFTDNTSLGNHSGSVTFTSGTALVNDSPKSVNLSGTILDHADAEFVGGSLDTLTLNFGPLSADTGAYSLPYQIQNLLASFRAGLELDSFSEVGDDGNPLAGDFTTNATLFPNLAPGSASSFFDVFFDTTGLAGGLYSATYVFDMSDQNLPGAINLTQLTLVVNAEVVSGVPEPSTYALGLVGLAGLGLLAWRRRK